MTFSVRGPCPYCGESAITGTCPSGNPFESVTLPAMAAVSVISRRSPFFPCPAARGKCRPRCCGSFWPYSAGKKTPPGRMATSRYFPSFSFFEFEFSIRVRPRVLNLGGELGRGRSAPNWRSATTFQDVCECVRNGLRHRRRRSSRDAAEFDFGAGNRLVCPKPDHNAINRRRRWRLRSRRGQLLQGQSHGYEHTYQRHRLYFYGCRSVKFRERPSPLLLLRWS